MRTKELKLVIVFSLLILSLNLVYAEKLGIETENSYVPGDIVNIKITLYDEDSNKIQGLVNYEIFNYYSEIVEQGEVNSGEEVLYELPTNAEQGPWKIVAHYNDVEINNLFNVGELEKAEIKLEGDVLVIKNIGNTVYEKKILIYIGSFDQTASVFLDIGQTKMIRLIAPDGDYDVRVVEGNEENILKFEGVQLTGNVVGLESILRDKGFFKKYPMISVFLGIILLIIIVVIILKFRKKELI